MRTLRAAEVRELDRRAIEEFGVPSLVLMENASRAVAECAEELAGARDERPVVCLCGPGNNGGDGLAVARTLTNRGRRALVWALGVERAAPRSDLGVQLALAANHGVAVRDLADAAAREDLYALLAGRGPDGAALVVDALFGTGLARPLGAPFDELFARLERSGVPVLAVDVPSGLDADDGRVLGAAVRATATVTFVAPKRGLTVGEGPARAGRVHVAEIGIPLPLLREAGVGPT